MKRITYTILFSLFFFFLGANMLQAQAVESWDFEDSTIGDAFDVIGWNTPDDITAEVADDPVAAGNNVLEVTNNNYNAAPVLMFVLPEGSTLADYSSFTFKGYFAQGDVGYKDILVEAYQTMPTGQFANNNSGDPDTLIGTWNRALGGSTAWENITVDITNSLSLEDTIYIAFGFNAAGTGDIGGTGVATMWYADDVTLVSDEGGEETNLVTEWGALGRFGWPIIPTTEDGSASMGGTGNPPAGNWAALIGGFDTLNASETDAVVATGKLEFVGGGATSWSALRWGLFFFDTLGTLQYAGTDTARWSGNQDSWGYLLLPHSGANDQVGWANGGFGTQGAINGGGWISSNSPGGALGVINQAPRNAEMEAGIYNWAVSVHKLTDSTNELRYYLVKDDNSYWIGGTVVDTVAPTLMFNAVAFGINNGNGIEETGMTGLNLSEVNVTVGDPIDVPDAPWESYFIDLWGLSGEYNTLWPILNDSSTRVGDASMGGEVMNGWRALQGGFGQDIEISTEEAVIVEGQIEFEGGAPAENAYTSIRYALTYQDSNSTLVNALTDSATWSHTGNHFGYGFFPRTGTGTMSNGAGGVGTVWTVNNGNWASTWSNGGPGPIAAVNQQPRNADMVEGVYDFAISVHSIDDTTNEIRWYMVEENNLYWFGGTIRDTATTKKFNSILFGIDLFEGTAFNVIGMQVDKGDPIEVPDAPWESYFIDLWGLSGEYNTFWPILNDSTTRVGDASMGGEVMNGWRALQGGFGQDVEISTEEAVIVEGQIEFVGGAPAENAYTPMRYALTYQDSNSTLVNALTDSATWSHTGNHFGYGFHPKTGAGTMSNGNGGSGTVWTIVNGNWASTYSNNGGPIAAVNQAPRNADLVEGVYDFAISVHSIDDTTNEIRWYMVEENNLYWFGGIVRDTATTKKFNSILLGIDLFEGTEFKVIGMQVDKGDPIEVPVEPWEPYYVDLWGFFGENMGGWTISNTNRDGNVTISGDAPNTDMVALRGEFSTFDATQTRPLKITGNIEFEGGGFDESGSFRVGLFYTESAGDLVRDTAVATLPDSSYWNGTDGNASGYLFVPQSGSNGPVAWNGSQGTWGAAADTTWYSPAGYVLGSEVPDPSTGGAGEYEFEISVTPLGDGTSQVKFNLMKDDYSWVVSTVDDNDPLVTDKFNSIAFALESGNDITAINITDVQIDTGTVVAVDGPINNIPVQFALSQNYPNPFNPSTVIEFAVPKVSDVKLVVYDILGKEVAKLAAGTYNPGYHKINFNASHLASGVYFYRFEAGDFVSVKKLMLLK